MRQRIPVVADRRAFADSSGYFAVLDADDRNHHAAVVVARRLVEERRRLFTTNSVVTFPGIAHGALLSTRTCPYDITWTFLRDPAVHPDTSCVAEMKDPTWVVRR